MASEWVKGIYSPYSPLVYRRCVLSLGCSKTLTITIIELRPQSSSFSVVVATDANIEDVIESTTLADRAFRYEYNRHLWRLPI
ncbi:hypothetical protein ES703_15281 [subsurface metagenome]